MVSLPLPSSLVLENRSKFGFSRTIFYFFEWERFLVNGGGFWWFFWVCLRCPAGLEGAILLL